jgi:hypothetical protein
MNGHEDLYPLLEKKKLAERVAVKEIPKKSLGTKFVKYKHVVIRFLSLLTVL